MKIKEINYQKAFTLSVFAATGPFIVRDILENFDFAFFGLGILFYIAYITYIILALKEIRKT